MTPEANCCEQICDKHQCKLQLEYQTANQKLSEDPLT